MSTSKPLISVIMSVKNGEHDLPKSIGSIQAQTIEDWEMIVCDDGSTDNTLTILYKMADEDARIKVLHNDRSQGLAYSLNRCIAEAKSNILARQDADDWSDSRRFEIQYPFVVSHPEYAIIGTGWYNVLDNGDIHPVKVLKEPTALNQVCGGHYMHPSWMMRKEDLEKVGFYTVNDYTMRDQDYHLVMKVLGAGMKMYNMSECLYYYTADEGMMKRTRNWKRVKGLMWIRWDSYRRNHLPWWCYIYVLKPLISHLIPESIMFKYHNKKFKNGH